MRKYYIVRIDILPSHNGTKVTRLTEPSEIRPDYGKYLEYRLELPDEEKCNECQEYHHEVEIVREESK